jgi:autotransporter-associated beta strand protein
LFVVATVAISAVAAPLSAQQPRALGLDISAWQGNISQTTWNNIRNLENRQFVFLRSSRGGTTGYYNQNNADNDPPTNTLSQRYDDPYYIQNINRATTAGIYAGSYHFSRPDIIATTLNANGIPNNGADEANHFMQMAGPWMRPGYLLPVHDLEAGQAQRSPAELSAFAVDFSNRIYEVMGFRPIVYSSQSYANYVDATVPPVYPNLWIARWPQGSGNPFTGNLQTDNPPPSPPTANVYGEWNPNHTIANPYPDGHPWKFWQYGSGERLQSFNNGQSNLDGDVANGGIEFVKDHLVPALWMNDNDGEWTTLTNWNSGQTPVAPVQGPGQVPRVGAMILPAPRLPGAPGSGVTSGQNDTVILDRPNANITVTISSGVHNVRKLYVREALNITGGSLMINYDNPKYEFNDPDNLYDPASGPLSAQFSNAVSLSGSASMSVYRLQVDPNSTFTLGGGSLTFNQIDLMRHAGAPAQIAMTGNVNFLPYGNDTATIVSQGVGNSGVFDLSGGARTFNVDNGAASIDMAVNVPIVNGGLTKAGLGTLSLGGANTYAGDTIVHAGQLNIGNSFLADAADVRLSADTTLNLGFSGNDVVRSLYLDGVSQPEGIWGPEGSGAQFTSPLLTGSGFLHVTTTPPPPPPPNPGNVLDHFEVDEGHFNWAYNTSPPSQTFGLAGTTTIERVTTQHQSVGAASQELNLVSDGSANWQIRHNSGIGSPAQPGSNAPLAPTGYVGFWLKTDDAGAGLVQIGIDDPVPAGPTAIEMGQPLPIIADNQWHLYQWNLEEDNWVKFNAGTNGAIDAVNGTITIDSIWITGSGDVQLYFDTMSHNPNGMLAAYIPGDYDRNGVVEAIDKEVWMADYGKTVPPGTGADGTGNGIVDAGDYLIWRKRLAAASGAGGGTSATPEPGALVLLLIAAGAAGLIGNRSAPVSRVRKARLRQK